MIVAIDSNSAHSLRSLIGAQLLRVVGHRYPNPPSYHQVELHTDRGVTRVALRSEDVCENLEVCCIAATFVEAATTIGECDEMCFADFRIDRVLVLRRAEWLETAEPGFVGEGENAQRHLIAAPHKVQPWFTHALVDAGLELVDERGSRLCLEADSFPLVLQCRYSITSSALPRGDSRSIDE